MDILPVKPTDDSRGSKDLFSQRPQAGSHKEAGRALGGETQAPSEVPDTEGVTASVETQGGSTRDAAEPKDTKDHGAAPLVQFLDKLAPYSPADTRLEIEVDPETEQSRFVVRNRDTGEVLREIPAEDILPRLRELAAKGMLFDHRF